MAMTARLGRNFRTEQAYLAARVRGTWDACARCPTTSPALSDSTEMAGGRTRHGRSRRPSSRGAGAPRGPPASKTPRAAIKIRDRSRVGPSNTPDRWVRPSVRAANDVTGMSSTCEITSLEVTRRGYLPYILRCKLRSLLGGRRRQGLPS